MLLYFFLPFYCVSRAYGYILEEKKNGIYKHEMLSDTIFLQKFLHFLFAVLKLILRVSNWQKHWISMKWSWTGNQLHFVYFQNLNSKETCPFLICSLPISHPFTIIKKFPFCLLIKERGIRRDPNFWFFLLLQIYHLIFLPSLLVLYLLTEVHLWF